MALTISLPHFVFWKNEGGQALLSVPFFKIVTRHAMRGNPQQGEQTFAVAQDLTGRVVVAAVPQMAATVAIWWQPV